MYNEEDINGGKSTDGTDIEQVQAEDVKEGKSSVPEDVPYSRFKEVNDEKKSLQDQVNRLTSQMTEIVSRFQSGSNSNNADTNLSNKPPVFDTVDELVSHIERNAESKINSELAPLKQQIAINNYVSNLDKYFSGNPDAQNMRDKMDEYTTGFNESRRSQFINAISSGDTSVLDEIYYTVSAKNGSEIKNMARESVAEQAKTALSPKSARVVKNLEPSLSDHFKQGIETRNFKGYFDELAKNFV